MEKISILSSAFEDGEEIPIECTCFGKDISPELSWSKVPNETKSITIIMEDVDTPKRPMTHWIIFNIPAKIQNLPEGVPKGGQLKDGIKQGRTDFNELGYEGPCPQSGKAHRYYFRIYALDKMLEIMAGSMRGQVENFIAGHILAEGDIVGIYTRE
jgi:Raf kinase inhibitor-like YbhB/YbcL family protein